MFRSTVILLSLVLTACDVGDASNGQNIGGTDAGKTDGMGSGSGSNQMATCINSTTPLVSHVHSSPVQTGNPSNAGINCMGVGCHQAGGGGPLFGFGGTLYTTSG